MGCHPNIDFEKFPRQGKFLGKEVVVLFHYNLQARVLDGVIVRDDTEEPFIGIIKLADERFVLMTECQYRFKISSQPGGYHGTL